MPQGCYLGAPGCPCGQFFFFKYGYVAYLIDGHDEQNRMQLHFFILESNWCPWGEVKDQILLNFGYHGNFKDFYSKLCVCYHK